MQKKSKIEKDSDAWSRRGRIGGMIADKMRKEEIFTGEADFDTKQERSGINIACRYKKQNVCFHPLQFSLHGLPSSVSLCSLKMPENSGKWLSLSKHGRKNKVSAAAFIVCSSNLWGYVTGWSRDSQGANVQAAYHWPLPMPRSWERCRKRNWQDLWLRSSAVWKQRP